MYNLIIDLGNTKAKFSVFNDANNVFNLNVDKEENYYYKNIDDIMSEFKINYCIISKLNNTTDAFLKYLETNFKTIIFNHTLNLPINIKYLTPITLGTDRIAAVVGAQVCFPNTNLLVIDAGTAITYDLLLNNGDYMGGNISLGVSARYKALHEFASSLPLLEIQTNIKKLYGETTTEAIICGVQNGVIHEVQGVIEDFKKQYEKLLVIFTGGEMFFFENIIKNCNFAKLNLVTIGLNKILEINV